MYKIGARHPVLRRGEARGSRTAGQVGASGCGLTWGPSANVGPGSSSATAPILGLPCAMERGTQLCSHTAPDAKKYTGDQNVPVPTSELRWEQKLRWPGSSWHHPGTGKQLSWPGRSLPCFIPEGASAAPRSGRFLDEK